MDNSLVSIGKASKLIGVSVDTLRRWDNGGKFSSVRIGRGGNRYFRSSDIDLFLGDFETLARKWASDTFPYEPDSEFYCMTRDIFQVRLERFGTDLAKNMNSNLASLVSAITGEIGNNSYDHNLGNWPDVLGIFFSYSLTEKKVVLADRGLGILTTLKKVRPKLLNHKEALKVAFTETLSGRAPENRGNGLKFVRNVITTNPIKLLFQTGNACIKLEQNQKDLKINLTKTSIPGCLAVVKY